MQQSNKADNKLLCFIKCWQSWKWKFIPEESFHWQKFLDCCRHFTTVFIIELCIRMMPRHEIILRMNFLPEWQLCCRYGPPAKSIHCQLKICLTYHATKK